MACPGKRGNGTCGSTVWKCKHCNSVGCDQGSAGKCTNQKFKGGTCQSCGKSGGKTPV